MEIVICSNAEKASLLAAKVLKNQIKLKPDSVLGLATGQTPLKLYKNFRQIVADEKLNLNQMTCFNLDEYVGVSADHPGSYSSYMQKHLFEPLGITAEQWHIPKGDCEDVPNECYRYENLISEKGPINLQVLGIGRDGHIGFNEPGSSFGSRTRLKTLTAETREDNAELFSSSESLPQHVITMGIQTIMETEQILLLAFGEGKSRAVADFVEGPVTASVPASILQFHPRVKVFLDETAASQLVNKSYYKEVFSNKPAWQMAEFV